LQLKADLLPGLLNTISQSSICTLGVTPEAPEEKDKEVF